MLQQLKNKKLSEITFSRVYKAIVRRIKDVPHKVTWGLPLKATIENKKKLQQYRDIHKGKRCFIIANGPSLKQTDLSLLKDEITIGMNRIYLMKDVNGFVPKYLVVADIDIQLKQFAEEYNKVTVPRFFHWNTRNLFDKSDSLMFFKESFDPSFQPDVTLQIGTGKSVTYTCMQLAYYFGCSEVILIGKDHNYNISGTPHSSINSDGKEDNHFIKGYYKKGMKWDVPDFIGEEFAYSLARKAFEQDGRKILDATIGGKLTVFEKIDYYSLFSVRRS